MRNRLHIIFGFVTLLLLGMTGCESFLNEPNETKLTTEFLISSPEGLHSTVVAMYAKDRELFRNSGDGESVVYLALLMGDDITVPIAGEGIPQFGRYNNLLATTNIVGKYWRYQYILIEYANTVINASEQMNKADSTVIRAVAEAKCFRAHAYLRLLQRYDRVYLNTRSTTLGEQTEAVVKKPAAADDVYALITSDLQDAIRVLPLTTPDQGRFTRGAARHILAKAAAYMNDWLVVANQVDTIATSGVYQLLPEPYDVFGAGDLNHSEGILVSQWCKALGGWYTNYAVNPVTNNGHRMSLHTTPTYNQEQGMIIDAASGGYPWGRLFPNNHLFSLYNQANDKRYSQWYKHFWTLNDKDNLGRGQHIGDTIFPINQGQYKNVHPMCTKYMDSWTKASPDEMMSFKDIIIYRFAETCLLGCEAYLHLNNQTKAVDYFNMTYTRAGNAPWSGTLTMQDFMDEHARELCMEGDRWNMLKREGELINQVRRYGGEYLVDAKGRTLMSDTLSRINIQPYHVRWPIPQTQIELMGPENFPQNEGY